MTLSGLELLINEKWAMCGRSGDDYYRAFTEALVRREMSLTPECARLRAEYDAALKDYLACVESSPAGSPARADHVELALAYQSMLASRDAIEITATWVGQESQLSEGVSDHNNYKSSPASELNPCGLKG